MQAAHYRHVQDGDHHGLLLAGQWRAGQGHWQRLARGGTQQRVMHSVGVPIQVRLIKNRILPVGHRGGLNEAQELGTLKFLHRGREQAGNGRVGEANAPTFIDHQDTFGGMFQHRSVECPGRFQVMAQTLQCTAVTLMLQ
ncbi:hypothetical protein D3C86_1667360 [compost metagenome]